MECQKIPVKVAAQILGIGENEIRYQMEKEMYLPQAQRTLPIGQARKSRTGKTLRYDVYKNKVMEYAGLKEWPE